MRLVLFDLDDTLLDGDCSALWNDWMVECGWVDSPGDYLARTQAMNAAYHAGRLKLEQYLAVTLSPLAGRHEAEVAAEVETFVTERIAPRFFPQGRALITRLESWLAERNATASHLCFYSDSQNDLPLLNRVDRPVAVNPDPVLAEVARVEGWERLEWRQNPQPGASSSPRSAVACG